MGWEPHGRSKIEQAIAGSAYGRSWMISSVKGFVALPELAEDHPRVKCVLGERWLERGVAMARVAMQRRNNLSPSMIGMTQGKLSHPLVSEAYRATDDAGALTGETLTLDLLELDLRSLGENLPDNLAARLRIQAAARQFRACAAPSAPWPTQMGGGLSSE